MRHPETGKYRRTRLFVMTLGYSRKSVRLIVFKSSARIWAELQEQAFRRLGGVTKVVVHDNLKEGVLTPDIYDPALNPLFRDVLKHYRAVALPCRVRDPDRKGKVESGVGHAQRTPLKGMRFEALDEAQAYLDRWDLDLESAGRRLGQAARRQCCRDRHGRPATPPRPCHQMRATKLANEGPRRGLASRGMGGNECQPR